MVRFFTVYGPWGRPDMALFKFVAAILDGRPIDVYNHGRMKRDFTFVDDLIEAMVRLRTVAPPPAAGRDAAPSAIDSLAIDSLSAVAPWRVVNIGAGRPVDLEAFIAAVESACERPAIRNYMEMQQGDVPATFADTDLLCELTGYRPATPIEEGVPAFVAWYKAYHKL
jgi:UDP-glucuronate 4-epimerase